MFNNFLVLLQSLIFDEVDLSDASVAETSTKNINNSFTVSTHSFTLSTHSFTVIYGDYTRFHSFHLFTLTSFQVITPFRKLMLCAESRKEMEDWISALKSVQKWETYEVSV